MNFKKPAFNYSGKGLTEFPEEIFSASRVYKLDLSHNNIKEIPKEIADLKHLETLDLSFNNIRTLKAKLFELPNLKILNLNNNEILNIPKQIGSFDKLKILSLANNKISIIPADVCILPVLEELNLSGNQLLNLPQASTSFRKLKNLWIANNPLTNLTAENIRYGMPNLKAVYFYSGKLTNPFNATDRGIVEGAAVKGNCIKQINTDYNLELVSPASAEKLLPKLNSESDAIVNQKKEPMESRITPKVFISYSHDDKDYLKPLRKHLKVLNYDLDFEVWDDTRIRSSQKWKEEIDKALHECTAAILLVSTNFLASDFIRKNELPPLLKAAEERGVNIHPVIVLPCAFIQTKSISQFQAVNSPDETLSELPIPGQERVWLKLCNDIQYFFEQKSVSMSALGETG